MQIAGDATRVGARGRDRFKAFYGGGTLLREVTRIVVLPECEFLKAVLRGIADHRARSFAHETARVIATSLNGEGALHLRAENHGGIHTDDGQQFSRTTTAAAQQFGHSLGELFQQRCVRGIVRAEFQAPSHGGKSGESAGMGFISRHGSRG